MAKSLNEDKRDKCGTYLALSATTVAQTSTQDLLFQYWAGKSTLTPKAKYSIMDHCRNAGGRDPIKDVT